MTHPAHLRSLIGVVLLLAHGTLLAQGADSAAIVERVRDVYASIDSRDTAALRNLFVADARRFAQDGDDAYRAVDLTTWLQAIAHAPDARQHARTRLWNAVAQAQGSIVQVFVDYDTRGPNQATRCGIGVADLMRVNAQWQVVALTETSDRTCTPPPGSLQVARRVSTTPVRHATGTDSVSVFESVRHTALVFTVQWKRAWMVSSIARDPLLASRQPRPLSNPLPGMRIKAAHCHTPDNILDASQVIWSSASKLAACVAWYGDQDVPADEREQLDTVLSPSLRGPIAESRQLLLDRLASAAALFPRSHFLSGQRVRFLVDQGKVNEALDVAQSCLADRWWCASLVGYVLQRQRRSASADSAFRAATRALTESAACAWTDLQELLPPEARVAYTQLSCTERVAANARLWWLADPLYSEEGNERRAEHFARKVLVLLNAGLERNERQLIAPSAGGSAILSVVTRYGWPTFFGWAGLGEDEHHDIWLGRRLNPYTSFEYAGERSHTLPTWEAIQNPFAARSDDWSVLVSPESSWTRYEHYRPVHPFLQLAQYQVGIFRRPGSLLLALAADLNAGDLRRDVGDSIGPAYLILSDSVDSYTTVATTNGVVGKPLVLSGTTHAASTIVDMEFVGGMGFDRPGARLRFGMSALPSPLANAGPSIAGISDPILLILDNRQDAPNAAERAIPLMMGSTRFRNDVQLGIYWEMYGLQPEDTAEVAVWVERTTKQGAFRRVGIALDLSRNLNTPLVARWSQQLGTGASVTPGLIPIVGRGLRLDVSQLPKGEYALEIVVSSPRRGELRGRRTFTIQD